jgi:hypothetical protein
MDSLSPYLSYTRLTIIFGAWFLVTDYPEYFLVLMCFQHLIYIIQQWTLHIPKEGDEDDEKAESELSKQLRILITRLSTSIMIFAVIRQSLDHARHKNKPASLRDVDYTDPNMAELMKATTIDQKTQNYCFIMTCLFFVDFISAWFD